MRLTTILFLSALTFTGCQRGPSDIKLPSLIGDNMLLQQKTNARIWGTATPGHKISVSASWHAMGQSTAGKDGKWSVILPVPEAGGPYTIKIAGRDTSILIENVLLGEVWFCSGQSNMEMPVAGWPPRDTIMHSAETIAGVQANLSMIAWGDGKEAVRHRSKHSVQQHFFLAENFTVS